MVTVLDLDAIVVVMVVVVVYPKKTVALIFLN